MECPRCGFSQPKDKYCANCGVDVEAYEKKPSHIALRILNNSTLHLTVIFAVIFATLFYLVVSQRELIQQEVGRIFDGIPLLSHSAEDDEEVALATPEVEALTAEAPPQEDETLESEASIIEPDPANRNSQTNAISSTPRVQIRYLEVSKENIQALIASGRVVRELENWRIIYIPSSPSVQSLARAARPLPGSVQQALPPRGELELISGDIDPDPNRSFLNFSMIWRIPDQVEWSLITQLRSPDTQGPGQLILREHEGRLRWSPEGALVLIFDPIGRIPTLRDADFSRSPLQILQSADFQSGLSDLIIWVEVSNLQVY